MTSLKWFSHQLTFTLEAHQMQTAQWIQPIINKEVKQLTYLSLYSWWIFLASCTKWKIPSSQLPFLSRVWEISSSLYSSCLKTPPWSDFIFTSFFSYTGFSHTSYGFVAMWHNSSYETHLLMIDYFVFPLHHPIWFRSDPPMLTSCLDWICCLCFTFHPWS